MRRIVSLTVVLGLLSACTGGARSRQGASDPVRATGADAGNAGTVAVPDVRGRDVASARAALGAAGLAMGNIEAWPDSLGYPAGTVVAQRPARGTAVANASRVDLRIYGLTPEDVRRATAESTPEPAPLPSDGPPTSPAPSPAPPPATGPRADGALVVPDLVGKTLEEATDLARRAGFEVIPLRVRGQPAGQVLSQDLVAGSAAPAGSPIGVKVATGEGSAAATPAVAESPADPAPVLAGAPVPADGPVGVPGVLDRTGPQARRILEGVGLRCREEVGREAVGTTGLEGRVAEQRPAAGERVALGTEIVVVIPPAMTTPVPVPAPVVDTPAPSPSAPPSTPPAPPAPVDPGSPDGGAPSVPAGTGSPDAKPVETPPITPGTAPVPAAPEVVPPAPVPVPDGAVPPAPVPVPDGAVPPAPVPVPDGAVPPAPVPVPDGAAPPAPAPIVVLEIPELTGPVDGCLLATATKVRIEFTWTAVPGVDGYLLELEEQFDDAWAPILRSVRPRAGAEVEIAPSDPKGGLFRWRVRSVAGARGGRAAPWSSFRLR